MTDILNEMATRREQKLKRSLSKRYRQEVVFKAFGVASIVSALLFLVILLWTIFAQGHTAFQTTQVRLSVDLDPVTLGLPDNPTEQDIFRASFGTVLRDAIMAKIPEASSRRERRAVIEFISTGATYDLRDKVIANPELIGQTIEYWALAGDDLNQFNKGNIDRNVDESNRQFKDNQIAWFDKLDANGDIKTTFNTNFFTNGDSRDAEMAGIAGSIVGSFYVLVVTLLLSFPIGVAAAVYLEEFAPKNRVTEIIEININNLAAVPSIVFGLLGLAIFLNVAHLPRSAPVVGGLVLTLMSLPTIIISSRAAIKAVPPSIREAATGMGASKMQVVLQHVLPLAMPGMMTGTIIAMAQALGETAPLLMIGMVAFIVDIPSGPMDAATVLPVQIYTWAENPELGFRENTSGAIIVLLGFLAFMNATAVYLRKRLERRW
ncbi:phosphate ABC transporter permease PstA [Salinibius halmophilus]|uniref:phosphate ABC transporter permease PstA n=1 Tax=Salinibius halmophilus TaxID=1853216 RepID=UPI000E660E04|nr:phosphate ABC transporter permease PstA [Salinibius halmophilus]